MERFQRIIGAIINILIDAEIYRIGLLIISRSAIRAYTITETQIIIAPNLESIANPMKIAEIIEANLANMTLSLFRPYLGKIPSTRKYNESRKKMVRGVSGVIKIPVKIEQ